MAVRGVAARDGGGHPAPAATRGGRAGTPQGRQLRPDTPGTRRPEGGPMRSMLNPDQRAGALKKLAEQTFDVVVVGGGVTGVGTALDAVSRGLSVALLEAGDLANGTSSRSEEHTSELQSLAYLVCRLLLEKKKKSPIILLYGKNKKEIHKT